MQAGRFQLLPPPHTLFHPTLSASPITTLPPSLFPHPLPLWEGPPQVMTFISGILQRGEAKAITLMRKNVAGCKSGEGGKGEAKEALKTKSKGLCCPREHPF